jgi:rhombotail lipoprotein
MDQIRGLKLCLALILLTAIGGCSHFWNGSRQQQTNSSSLVNYLYPNGSKSAVEPVRAPTLDLPLRVGLAFVPQTSWSAHQLSEVEKANLLESVRLAFLSRPYVASIDVVPEIYLQTQRGFTGLEQIGRLHGFDVMALVSYDQLFNSDDRASSLLYWTIVGAYVVPGTSNSVNTFVDTAVFDLDTHQLLFRAPGVDTRERRSTAVEVGRSRSNIGVASFNDAIAVMIPNLDSELERFSQDVRDKKRVAVVNHRPGYGGGGQMTWFCLIGLGLLAGLARYQGFSSIFKR